MIEEEKQPSQIHVILTRAVFLVGVLLASLSALGARTALRGAEPWYEIGLLWLLPALIGIGLWTGPKRGQMNWNISNSLLLLVGLLLIYIGDVLKGFAEYARHADSIAGILK
jgi:hypothetical protein